MYEVLKATHTPFRHRWLIGGREVDFVLGTLCLEVNGHEQDIEKNHLLISLGYTPVHINNEDVTVEHIKQLLSYYNAY